MRPRCLDLYCGAGGASMGLYRAGFDPLGVDVIPQPNYPFEFLQLNVMSLTTIWRGWPFVWASPPCQRYSDLAARNGNSEDHPDLIPATRALLKRSGMLYAIENVKGAPLIDPVVLCGTMFSGLRVLRHRGFEVNFPVVAPPHGKHPKVHTFDKRKSQYGKTNDMVDFVQVTGGGNCTMKAKYDAMGIDWKMSEQEINNAIPPAYAEFIGRAALKHINLSATPL